MPSVLRVRISERSAMTISPEQRATFEQLGIDFVRNDVALSPIIQDGAESLAALEWMHEQNVRLARRDALRFWWMFTFTFIAAVAASIAAWPVILEWLD
jgi:hypothetical protein